MNVDTSFLSYFMNAGLVVKLVMLLLISASILSWTHILQRAFFLKTVRNATSEFERLFWSGGDLSKLYSESSRRHDQLNGLETIFHAGFKEFLRLHKQTGVAAESVMEGARRAMRVAIMREQDKLELNLPILATVGSASPYVGLFGMVWGISLSFQALGHAQQATIAMVAPGIVEALMVTALGLFAAIPAVVAYNRFSTEINRLLNRFDGFQDEFSNILFRQAQMNQTTSKPAMAE